MTRARLKVVGMHAGDDADAHDGGQPAAAPEKEPRGYRRIMRRYRTYLRLLAATTVVGLAVGVGSWWFFSPPAARAILQTCYEWNFWPPPPPMPTPFTDCIDGVKSGDALQRALVFPVNRQQRVVRSWPATRTEWVYGRDASGQLLVGPLALTAVRNGVIAAAVAYLLLILIVVPARMLKRTD